MSFNFEYIGTALCCPVLVYVKQTGLHVKLFVHVCVGVEGKFLFRRMREQRTHAPSYYAALHNHEIPDGKTHTETHVRVGGEEQHGTLHLPCRGQSSPYLSCYLTITGKPQGITGGNIGSTCGTEGQGADSEVHWGTANVKVRVVQED